MAVTGGTCGVRIVLISPEYPPADRLGGIATNTATVARELARREHDVAVVVTRGGAGTSKEGGVTVRRLDPRWLPNRRAERLLASREVAQATRSFEPDIVQAPEWEAPAWWLARFGGAPLITRLATPTYLLDDLNAGGPRRGTKLVRRLEREQARRSSAVLAPTQAIAERVAGDWGLDRERIEVIASPVDVEAVRRAGAGQPPADVPQGGIVFIGRLERRKGIDVLGRALAHVLGDQEARHAVLIGRDAGEDGGGVMERFWRDVAPVRDRVYVVGELPREQALPIVARADIVVLPSLWENLANACLEAMVLARPVVATRAGGFAELIDHGETGWLVPPGDAEALAAELARRLREPDQLATVGRRAAARAEELDVASVTDRLVELYEQVAASRSAFDETIYRHGYRRYFHPEDSGDPFRRLYEAKRSYVLARLQAMTSLRLLDVGGGYGRFAGPLSERHDVTLLDISPEMLEEARRRYPHLDVVEGDAGELPFRDESFDAVLALDLLPHLPDLEAALRELRRVARPDGDVIFDTTNAAPWWVLPYPRYVGWRPKRLLLTMLAGGVLPEWRGRIVHHRPHEVRRAIEAAGLRVENLRGFGPPFASKWHVWWTVSS